MHKIQEQILKLSTDRDLGKFSLRQIGIMINQTNQPQKIKHHLLQLEKKGLLNINRANRIIIKTGPGLIQNSKLFSVPILGSADCGPATIYAEQNIEGYLRVSGKILSRKKDIFAIQATGYSMNKANINGECIEDGDYVIVDPKYRSIKNGDYVLSIIDGVANIKKFFKDTANKRIILLSESSMNYSPIFIHFDDIDRYLVNGKIIQVIKKPNNAWSKFKRLLRSS